MKIDTQGSEYEILKGGNNVINNAIGFEIEIEFKEMYLNQPLFNEVNQFLLEFRTTVLFLFVLLQL